MSDVRRVLSADAADVDLGEQGLDDAALARLYEAMVTTRAVDERARRLHADGEIGFYVASRGLEGVAVGAVFPLQGSDWLFPSHRDLGMFLWRGGSLRAWFDQLFGNAADLTKGRRLPGHASLPAGRFVAVPGRVGAQAVHAVGCALAMRRRRQEACALACFGEAAAAGADFLAALTIAARFGAPAVLVCRSAESARGAHTGTAAPLAQRARDHGLLAARVDGTDVLAVLAAVREARDTALRGGGATLVEAVLDESALFGAAARGNGPSGERRRDPLARLADFLEEAGVWDAAREEELGRRLRARVDEAVEAARSEPAPDAAVLFDDVYEELPWLLQEQRERLLAGDE